jgi:ABC-2 type transport system ATP-binding protein
VDRFVADRPVWDRRLLGAQQSVVMPGLLDDVDWSRAQQMHLELKPLSLQDMVVYAAGGRLSIRKEEEACA